MRVLPRGIPSAALYVYHKLANNITGEAKLFYSPKSMVNGSTPKWNFSELEELYHDGIISNDFRFSKY